MLLSRSFRYALKGPLRKISTIIKTASPSFYVVSRSRLFSTTNSFIKKWLDGNKLGHQYDSIKPFEATLISLIKSTESHKSMDQILVEEAGLKPEEASLLIDALRTEFKEDSRQADNDHGDRVRVNPTTPNPYNAICLLDYEKFGHNNFGTGWILRNDNAEYQLIVTAGHCVYGQKPGKKTDGEFVTDMVIKPGYNDGIKILPDITPVTRGSNDMLFATTDYLNNKWPALRSPAAVDYGAILINSTNAEGSWQFSIYPHADTFKLSATLAGYPAEVNGVSVYGKMYESRGVLETSNDGISCKYTMEASEGQSGSPIWTLNDPNGFAYQVIGIHSKNDAATYRGVSAVYANTNFQRWLNPWDAEKEIQITESSDDGVTLEAGKMWIFYKDEVMVESEGDVVIGIGFYRVTTNAVALMLICQELNGEGGYYYQKQDTTKPFGVYGDQDRYFSKTNLEAPEDHPVVVGASMFEIKDYHIGLKILCENTDCDDEIWVDDKDDGDYLVVGTNDEVYVDENIEKSDINYTVITGVALSNVLGEYSLGTICTTDVCWYFEKEDD
eukprot:491131_1